MLMPQSICRRNFFNITSRLPEFKEQNRLSFRVKLIYLKHLVLNVSVSEQKRDENRQEIRKRSSKFSDANERRRKVQTRNDECDEECDLDCRYEDGVFGVDQHRTDVTFLDLRELTKVERHRVFGEWTDEKPTYPHDFRQENEVHDQHQYGGSLINPIGHGMHPYARVDGRILRNVNQTYYPSGW